MRNVSRCNRQPHHKSESQTATLPATSQRKNKHRRRHPPPQKRCWDVEPVFAQLKHNKNFKRFNLRGTKKVEIETGLLAIAHNLKKMAT